MDSHSYRMADYQVEVRVSFITDNPIFRNMRGDIHCTDFQTGEYLVDFPRGDEKIMVQLRLMGVPPEICRGEGVIIPDGALVRAQYINRLEPLLYGQTALIRNDPTNHRLFKAQFDNMQLVHEGRPLGLGWHSFSRYHFKLLINEKTIHERHELD